MKLQIEHHRNGVCGRGFRVVLFKGGDNERMVAICPDTENEDKDPLNVECYVLDIDKLCQGNISFGGDCISFGEGNSWRGDVIMSRLIESGLNKEEFEAKMTTNCLDGWKCPKCGSGPAK